MNRYSDQLIFTWRTTDTSQQYFNRGFNNPFNYGAKIKLQFTLHKS